VEERGRATRVVGHPRSQKTHGGATLLVGLRAPPPPPGRVGDLTGGDAATGGYDARSPAPLVIANRP